MNLKLKKHSGVSLMVFTFCIIAIFAFAALTIDLGMVLLSQDELQKAVESTALASVAALEPEKDPNSGNVRIQLNSFKSNTENLFNSIKAPNALIRSANVTVDDRYVAGSKAVMVTGVINARTYFLAALGIRGIRVTARAAAANFPVYLSPNSPRTPTIGSLLIQADDDTEVDSFDPDDFSASNYIANLNHSGLTGFYGPPDGKSVFFDDDGHVTIRMPAPIVDGPGADLVVIQPGRPQGYFVYIGLDNNPNLPYIEDHNEQSDIRWVNVSCTGIPVSGSPANTDGKPGAYDSEVIYNTSTDSSTGSVLGYFKIRQAKFYGSGVFDIGATCTRNGTTVYDGSIVKNARYIKIADDRVDDGFETNLSYTSSIFNDGISIDAVGALHHSRLMSSADFADSDGDGLINGVENWIGTNKTSSDTDSDGKSDSLEYIGWHTGNTPITQTSSREVHYTSPVKSD